MTTSSIDSVSSVYISRSAQSVWRFFAYPAILVANAALLTWAALTDASLEGVAFAALAGSAVALMALEFLLPQHKEWHATGKEWLRDSLYFGMNGAVDALAKLGVALLIAQIGVWNNSLPLWAAVPLGVLLGDFAGYWLHRWGHHGWLWKVHGVHHTPDKVNTWNNNTVHFFNAFYSSLAKSLILVLLGFSSDAIVIAAYILTLQSFAVHANVQVEMGKLNYWLMTPVHHRLHHSTKLEEAGNFASVTTLWDILFGTFVYAPGLEPRQVGVLEPKSFPEPTDIVRNQLHPFIDQGQNS